MKRSEMIESLRSDLIDILGNSPKVVNDITNTETLELILDLLESQGMIPPASTHMFPHMGGVNEWEPEGNGKDENQ